jgi:hypothetical protein
MNNLPGSTLTDIDGTDYELAGLDFPGWNNLEVHRDDILGWHDKRTAKMVFVMDPDGDLLATPCDDDVELVMLVKKSEG